MNWRLWLSRRPVLEALRAIQRIGIVVVACGLLYGSYHLYQDYSRSRSLRAQAIREENLRQKALAELRENQARVRNVTARQLQADAPAQFAFFLEATARNCGVQIADWEADTNPRAAIDHLAGATAIEGWVVLGQKLRIVGSYEGLRRTLESMQRFPMPLEFTSLSISRAEGELLQLELTLEVHQPGTLSGGTS